MGKESKQVHGEPFVTCKVRVQYSALAKPDEGHKYSRGKYGLRALVPKSDKQGLKEIFQSICNVAEIDFAELESKIDKHPLMDGKGRLRDGDGPKFANKEGHAGSMFFNTFTDNPVDTYVMGEDGNPVECDPEEIYDGCWALLALQPALYNADEGVNVTFYLQGVIKVEDDSRFTSSKTDTKSLFKNWAGNAGSATSPVKSSKKTAAPLKFVKAAEPEEVEDEEEEGAEEEVAPSRGRGRPAKVATNGNAKVVRSAKVEDDDPAEDDEEMEAEEEEAPKVAAPKVRTKKVAQDISALLD